MYKYLFILLALPLFAKSQDTTAWMVRATEAVQQDKIDSARYYFALAENRYLASGQWDVYTEKALRLAAEMYANDQFKAGIQLLKQADSMLVEMGQKLPEESVMLNFEIARGYNFLMEVDNCVELLKRNMSGMDTTSLIFANHQNLLGLSYYKKNHYLDALAAYQKALKIRLDSLGFYHDQVAGVFNNMGNTYSQMGLYNKALDFFNQALDIRRSLPEANRRRIAFVLANQGILYKQKGEYKKALEFFNEALSIFQEQAENSAYFIAISFNYLGTIYRNLGAYDEADAYHRQALEILQQASNEYVFETAAIYGDWAILHGVTKNNAKEIDLHKRSVSLYEQNLPPNDPDLITAKDNLGLAYLNAGQYSEALSQFQQILGLIDEDQDQQNMLANIYNNIGDVFLQQPDQNLVESRAFHQKALAIQQELLGEKSYTLTYTYNRLAEIAEKEGQPERALQYLERALAANHVDYVAGPDGDLPAADGFYRYDYFVESLLQMARVLQIDAREEELLRARALYALVDTTLNLVRNELVAADDKIRLSEKFYELSRAAIANSLSLARITGKEAYLTEAFAFSEKSKANVIAQSIAANQARAFAGIPDSLIALEDQWRSDINFYKLQLADQPDSAAIPLYQNELFVAQQAYRVLLARLEAEYPAYHALKYDTGVPDLAAIRSALPPSRALVSYLIGDTVLYSFVITRDAFSVHQAPIEKTRFLDLQTDFRKRIMDLSSWEYVQAARELYPLLFPFELDAGITSLVLIPDGPLSKLPFEALLSEEVTIDETTTFSDLPYLIRDRELQYALSVSLYHKERLSTDAVSGRGEGLVAYAPVFSEPQEIASFESGLRHPLSSLSTGATRSTIFDEALIAPLPGTAQEVAAIRAIFEEHGQAAESYLYKSASEHQLKERLQRQSRYLHIATHGLINEAQPELSGLLFHPDDSGQEDHILYSGEIYNLSLNTELVVLSACETGLGKMAGGEGLLGLSRAFFYAGADQLLVSLWKVEDQATAELMVHFYRQHLSDEQDEFAAPLREAKLQLIDSDLFSHPYYWSAFVLID